MSKAKPAKIECGLTSLFDVPPDTFTGSKLASSSTSSSSASSGPVPLHDRGTAPEQQTDQSKGKVGEGWTCSTCGVSFKDDEFELFRSHYRLDWHRFNLKRAIQNKPIVNEDVFEQLVEDSISSISGSDSDEEAQAPQDSSKSSLVTFETADQQHHITVLRCLVSPTRDASVEQLCAALTALTRSPLISCVILASGGHFAATVFTASTVVCHKTFHRYVVRKKAGGRQVTHDSGGKGPARSAGAQIRRHNEAALAKDIQGLLMAWSNEIQRCSLIFVRAAGVDVRAIFSSGTEGSHETSHRLSKHDPRVRSIPFPTRRPTFGETRRVLSQLTRATVTLVPLASPHTPNNTNNTSNISSITTSHHANISGVPSNNNPLLPAMDVLATTAHQNKKSKRAKRLDKQKLNENIAMEGGGVGVLRANNSNNNNSNSNKAAKKKNKKKVASNKGPAHVLGGGHSASDSGSDSDSDGDSDGDSDSDGDDNREQGQQQHHHQQQQQGVVQRKAERARAQREARALKLEQKMKQQQMKQQQQQQQQGLQSIQGQRQQQQQQQQQQQILQGQQPRQVIQVPLPTSQSSAKTQQTERDKRLRAIEARLQATATPQALPSQTQQTTPAPSSSASTSSFAPLPSLASAVRPSPQSRDRAAHMPITPSPSVPRQQQQQQQQQQRSQQQQMHGYDDDDEMIQRAILLSLQN